MSDIRDGNTYRIRKLADGNCWMTENLRLKITKGQAIEISDGSMWTPTNYSGTTTRVTTLTISDLEENRTVWQCSSATGENCIYAVRSFDTEGIDGKNFCGYISSDSTAPGTERCYETASTNDGDIQKIGVYYNVYAATAGQVRIDTAFPSVSICPKNWQIPTNLTNNNQPSYRYLVQYAYELGYGYADVSTSAMVFPMSFIPGGRFRADNGSPTHQNVYSFNMLAGLGKAGDDAAGTLRNVVTTDIGIDYSRATSTRIRNGGTIRCAIKGT